MDGGAWQATVHGIATSRTRLRDFTFTFLLEPCFPQGGSSPLLYWAHLLPPSFQGGVLRGLLLGRKVMTNLDSIFKSRDITFPTKVHLVKAMVFSVVMYGCESWTVKKTKPRLGAELELRHSGSSLGPSQ